MTALLQATARRLCKLDAECFGVTLEDLWAERGESYLIDAQEVVEATGAGELLAALQAICAELGDDDDFSAKQIARHAGRAAIAKALGEQP
jgi:hypothetical protein